jgi:hypothetical protein
MKLLNYIDKHTTYNAQRRLLTSLPLGAVFGYSLAQIIVLVDKGWQKYNFDIVSLIILFVLWSIVLSPFIINRFKCEAKYKRILTKINTKEKNFVKARFDYSQFKKGQSYPISIINDNIYLNFSYFTGPIYDLKGVINKFEYDDLKEERLRKLKRLKRI